MGEVRTLAEHADDARYDSPAAMLQRALDQLRDAEHPLSECNNALFIGVVNDADTFRVSWRNAGLSCTDMLALAEIIKVHALQSMGHIPEDG